MKKPKKEFEYHQDLVNFEEEYNSRINKFLESDSETKIVFLNADFGWGKTTFIKNNIKVAEHCIYSPWLNNADNYLEEIYYNVSKKDKGFINSKALFIMSLISIMTIMSGSIISVLLEIFKSNVFSCILKDNTVICSTNDKLSLLLLIIGIIISVLLVVFAFIIFKKPVPLINFLKKDTGKYYEKKLINRILKKVEKVLVIEDIDRIDNIEDVLIAANKISEVIKDQKQKKYILITGDYVRTIRRISEPMSYDSYIMDFSQYRTKGTFLIDKIISLRIDFSSIKNRIDNILKEYNISTNIKRIEYDEIINFIKSRYLSIRFFEKFLKCYKEKIKDGYSIYYLLLNYYQDEKYFNPNALTNNKILYNSSKYPECMNDIEMILQCKDIKMIDNNYKEIKKIKKVKGNCDIFTNAFSDLLSEENISVNIFNNFYISVFYPRLEGEKADNNGNITIGSRMKPNNFKTDLDNYLISYNNINMMEGISINKRCYFSSITSTNNYESYKINQIDYNLTVQVNPSEFVIAYIACFLRDNKDEIKNNYPEISKFIEKITGIKDTNSN